MATWANEQNRAYELCRGSYQAGIVDGSETLSGSSLIGAAKNKWGRKYQLSRESLISRLAGAGIEVVEAESAHGKRVLVWGTTACRLARDVADSGASLADRRRAVAAIVNTGAAGANWSRARRMVAALAD